MPAFPSLSADDVQDVVAYVVQIGQSASSAGSC
jgi:hypothetical protein